MKPPADWAALFGDGPVVIDGGLSTQLARRGQDTSGVLWTGRVLLEDPQAVTRAHADFVAAGAEVVISASYQVSRTGFEEVGLTAADADAALRASLAAARAAVVGSRALVAASVGPYGAILHDGSEYRGRYGRTRQQLRDFHRERLEVLVEASPDLLAVETIPDVDEAEALAEALDGLGDFPAWVSFSAADGAHTCAGQRIEDAAAVAAGMPGAVAVGVNCTDPRHVDELIGRIAATVGLPIVVYANAGGSWDAATGEWSGARPDAAVFPAALIDRWRASGAVAIGGCCGTDDAVIRQVAAALHGTGP